MNIQRYKVGTRPYPLIAERYIDCTSVSNYNTTTAWGIYHLHPIPGSNDMMTGRLFASTSYKDDAIRLMSTTEAWIFGDGKCGLVLIDTSVNCMIRAVKTKEEFYDCDTNLRHDNDKKE